MSSEQIEYLAIQATSFIGPSRFQIVDMVSKDAVAVYDATGQTPSQLSDRVKVLEGERAELLAFARDVGFNFDCDSDSHKYETTCRKCDALALIAKLEGTRE